MKRRAAILAMVLTGILTAITISTAAPSAAADTPYCGIRWGSLPKQSGGMVMGALVDVRAGRHACFDRLVFDFAGRPTGYGVEYVTQVTKPQVLNGPIVPLRGGAQLRITISSPAYDDSGNPTYQPADLDELVNVTGWRTFRQVAWAGSFEGESTVGLGVRARLPFRVFVLDGPGTGSRVVVDVAHRW